MPKLKDDRFGYLFDPFMRASYVVACMFADMILVSEFLLVTAGEAWSLPAGIAILLFLIVWEGMLYFRFWKDFKFTITDVEFNKPFVVEEREGAKIDVTIQNDGYMAIRDAAIEIYIDGKLVDSSEFTVEKGEIRNVTFDWQATPGKHKFGILVRAREVKRRKKDDEMDMTGEFVVRKGKKTIEDSKAKLDNNERRVASSE